MFSGWCELACIEDEGPREGSGWQIGRWQMADLQMR